MNLPCSLYCRKMPLVSMPASGWRRASGIRGGRFRVGYPGLTPALWSPARGVRKSVGAWFLCQHHDAPGALPAVFLLGAAKNNSGPVMTLRFIIHGRVITTWKHTTTK